MMVVAFGIVLPEQRATRTSADTASVLEHFLTALRVLGFEGADVVLDQLNTHWSPEIVRVVARQSGVVRRAAIPRRAAT